VILPAVTAFVRRDSIEDGLVGSFLQVHVERRVDPQAALMDLVGPR
jgi:hypothetical protein